MKTNFEKNVEDNAVCRAFKKTKANRLNFIKNLKPDDLKELMRTPVRPKDFAKAERWIQLESRKTAMSTGIPALLFLAAIICIPLAQKAIDERDLSRMLAAISPRTYHWTARNTFNFICLYIVPFFIFIELALVDHPLFEDRFTPARRLGVRDLIHPISLFGLIIPLHCVNRMMIRYGMNPHLQLASNFFILSALFVFLLAAAQLTAARYKYRFLRNMPNYWSQTISRNQYEA